MTGVVEDTDTLFQKLTGGLNRLLSSEFGIDAGERRAIENTIDQIIEDPEDNADELASVAAYLGVRL